MATISDGREFVVFKFESTGLVALCDEVAAYARSGELEGRFNVELSSARYRRGEHGEHEVVFDYKEDRR